LRGEREVERRERLRGEREVERRERLKVGRS
jgi:hypothetical protein